MRSKTFAKISTFPGDVSFFYKNLVTGENQSFFKEDRHDAAGLIKIPIMIAAFKAFEIGMYKEDDLVLIRDIDRVPMSGVLTLMHEGLSPSLKDIVYLMISVSDNMAANLLINRLSIPFIQKTTRELGLEDTMITRKLFDPAAEDMANYTTVRDMAIILERLYKGEIVSQKASRQMLNILSTQQLNHKIPFDLPSATRIAHKTGEDDNVTHDVGLIYAKEPFILCFCGSNVHAPRYNRVMNDVSKELFDLCGGLKT